MKHQAAYCDGLETERLVTRFLQPQDAEIWSRFCGNPLTWQFLIPFTETPAERARTWIESQEERYRKGTYGLQALIEKSTGAFVGQCGLLLQIVNGIEETEIGYHLMPEFWGKGYASEAAGAFKKYGFETFQPDSIVSIIHVHNTRSQNVAMRNGMKPGEQTLWRDMPIFLYRITKPEFELGKM